jgi:hypothetical protein
MFWILKGTGNPSIVEKDTNSFITPSQMVPQKKMKMSQVVKLLNKYDEDGSMTEGFVVLQNNARYLVQSWSYFIAHSAAHAIMEAIGKSTTLEHFFKHLEDANLHCNVSLKVWQILLDTIGGMKESDYPDDSSIFEHFSVHIEFPCLTMAH